MGGTKDERSTRARERARAIARARARAEYRSLSFEALAGGWTVEQIAEMRKVSPKTIRREVNAALSERPVMAPERYRGLQIARLTKAVRAADSALDRGDIRAIPSMIRAVQALDRYHGLGPAAPAWVGAAEAPAALPAPPLKLTHAPVDASPGVSLPAAEKAPPPTAALENVIDDNYTNSGTGFGAQAVENAGSGPEMITPGDIGPQGKPEDAAT